LQEQQRSPRTDFEQHFQQQLAETVADAWLLATNQDLRFPGVRLKGARPNPGLRLLHRYMDLVLYSAIIDPEIAQAYFNVLMLVNPPRWLVQPHMVAHVLTVAGKRTVKRLLGGEEDADFALSAETLAMLRERPSMLDARVL
jgi:hypothetical protein